ncbi:NAD-dependent succinate-semialdehyde dehydrogenase [Aestuariimicrobium sp. T2.26MG-19.2B]|uniref:NAD-dependent succinate-semialdehyde dehydrogenase n=1 Tax=Aestuariimicrobium sp. T2.26MG-19.2B TaxID=3040679 RepID=UPI002477B666|nr:NAD-dependent succinate-semialdehyde dehydrogenase [Aestuariimicrobium sp. T2.26MG-19.2B]CAI9404952.1 Glutarate-semialdehyde dehydrogenase [Aestuariimicrobium sp. T2.26MG-19.2B]
MTTFEVLDPATGQVLHRLDDQTPHDATAAVDAAAAALSGWRATPPRQRAEVLRRVFDLMLRDRDRLADLISSENGKSTADAVAEVTYAAEFFRWFSEEAVRSEGDYTESPAGGTRTIVRHVPVGVAALVTPWNFPAAMATRKLAPALAAGCTVVLKPAAETPLTALAVAALLSEAGLPDGVVSLVTTTDAEGVVGTWLRDRRVRKLSFTGSTAVGRHLLRQAADRVVNTSLELGGNAPVVVCADADLDVAVEGTMTAKFRGGGQACTAANRIFVHESVADEFVARLSSEVGRLTVGPASSGCAIGPVITPAARDRITRVVDEAVAAGAVVVGEGAEPPGQGWFVRPLVLDHVPADSRLLAEEVFGPVASVTRWSDEDDLVARVNDTEFGLSAYVFAELGHALHLAERIEAGMVGINRGLVSDPAAPFGGFKQSGLGREGAREGLREFQETQYFSVAW